MKLRQNIIFDILIDEKLNSSYPVRMKESKSLTFNFYYKVSNF